jgi:proline iminopeptidase
VLPLYPDTAPLRRDSVPVSGGHRIDVRQFGCGHHDKGIAALTLHGGPGSGSSPLQWRVFDPARYRVVCIDQRGCGASAPRGSTAHNTTDDLLDDLRRVREQLGIERWLVVGGSWGAALALAYAAVEPHAVSGLLLRSAFLARREDIDWFFHGAAEVCPQEWQAFAEVAPPHERTALLPWLARTLEHGTPAQQGEAALAWWHWEQALGGRPVQRGAVPSAERLIELIDRYRVQSHYLMHGCFFDDAPLLARCAPVPRVPALLIHGRDDQVCRPAGAQALQQALPQLALQWIDSMGHDAAHPAMVSAMVEALDTFASHARFAAGNDAAATA